jgi:hypothetical protein
MTVDLLRSGDWATKSFKDYNFQAKGRLPDWGSLHPLLKVRTQLRNILLEMGFEEMPTNKWVESSFWNFDALFQPQQHPARDSHDTFFLSSSVLKLHLLFFYQVSSFFSMFSTAAQETQTLPEDYVERVREMHQHGGDGSIGYVLAFIPLALRICFNMYICSSQLALQLELGRSKEKSAPNPHYRCFFSHVVCFGSTRDFHSEKILLD